MEGKTKLDRIELQQALSESGCCQRCLRRYKGFVDFIGEASLEPVPCSAAQETPISDSQCFVCLGLLGDRQFRKLVEYVRMKLLEANYDADHFVLSVPTVPTIEIRQTLLAMWLRDKFPSLTPTDLEEHSVSTKQALKTRLIEELPEKLGLSYRTNGVFDLKVGISAAEESDFFAALELLDPETFVMKSNRQKRAKKMKSQIFSRKSVSGFFASRNRRVLEPHFPFPPSQSLEAAPDAFVFSLTLEQEPLFIGGRYNKFSRELPQTPWVVDGVRLRESSVEELIVNRVKELVPADQYKFSSSGREDIDVLMLGDGRPFVVECLNPRRTVLSSVELNATENAINASSKSIRVDRLAVVTERQTAILRKSENQKTKHYTALCFSASELTEEDMKKLSQIRDLDIYQKTPIRVLHRRPLAVRPRRVHKINGTLVDERHFRVDLDTDAGTYIKEFVHGDLGRTQPNLKEIMSKDVDILELDVEKVDVEWPPSSSSPAQTEEQFAVLVDKDEESDVEQIDYC